MLRQVTLYILTILFVLLLQGCFGTAVSGMSAFYDRYNIQHKLSDQKIALMVVNEIKNEPQLENSRIEVSCFDHQVLLSGQEQTNELRNKASEIAASVVGVEHVYNFIEKRKPIDTSQLLRDSWLTAKIKSKIIADAKMDPGKIKVITENSTVYLLGVLTRKQADLSVEVARFTPGVKHVVKIFKYVLYSKR